MITCRVYLTWRDLCRLVQHSSSAVVCTEDILLCGCCAMVSLRLVSKQQMMDDLLMTPCILFVISSMSLGFEGCFDRIRTAELSTTVEIAFRPAALMVSPLSTRSTIPSATPSAQAASTLPPTYLIVVRSLALPSPFTVVVLSSSSSFLKYASDKFVKLVTTFLPTSSFGSLMPPSAGTWTCSLQAPNPRFKTSSTPVVAVGGVSASCSAT